MNNPTRPHQARKRFGQHFLTDRSVLDRIVRVVAPRPEQTVVEIGPGLGALTEPLLEEVTHLTVIELDRDLAARLTDRYSPERITVIQQDVLNTILADIRRTSTKPKLSLVGNLPYNISTPLIFHLLEQLDEIESMVFMVQREVALRLTASAGTKQYGRLSVMAALSVQTESLFDVPPTAFDPPPKVDSSVIRLTPRIDAVETDLIPQVSKLVAGAFGQRRKTLRNALSGIASNEQMQRVGIDPGHRAEVLAPEDYVRLAALLRSEEA